jgi:hypothetical protein
VIRLLLALHPRSWRAEYGEELRDLLRTGPLTAAVIVDVLRNAGRQHVRAHPLTAWIVGASSLSVVVEIVAVHAHVTANIVWPPSTPVRTLTLGVLVACWVPVARRLGQVAQRRLAPASGRRQAR